MVNGDRRVVAEKLREAGLTAKASRFETCHQSDEGFVYVCHNCGQEMIYVPFSCRVIGCPTCSHVQSAPIREAYEDALLALWLKREAGEWSGRFWFLTFTYRMDDGESVEDALDRVRRSFDSLSRWVLTEYGAGEGGVVTSLEIGPKQLEETGQAGQVHVHAVMALDSPKQIGRYRFIVGKESGHSLIIRADFDKAGEVEKRKIESKWIELVGKDCPVSRVYEVAPGGLPLSVDKDRVKESLERLGLYGDVLKKAVYYNTRATIRSACCELLKYVTKTAKLSPEALAQVIIAFHRKRRVWSFGVFYGKRRKALVDYFEGWKAGNDGRHPFGDRESCKCKKCSHCGGDLALESAWSVSQRDPAGLARALAAYMARPSWLDTGSKSGHAYSWRAPPGLVRWLKRLESGQKPGVTMRVINLNDW